MVVDAREASRALDEIEAVKGRISELRYYRRAGPYFILWGLVWLIGNGSVEFVPHDVTNTVWTALVTLGVAGSILLGVLQGAQSKKEGAASVRKGRIMWLRSMAIAAMVFGFIYATMMIFAPTDAVRMNAFISVTVGFVYMATGLAAAAWRVFALGLAVAILTMAGYVFVADHFFIWMALVGGGSLIVGGLLVRKA